MPRGRESPLDTVSLLLPAAELLLPAFPGGRLPDHAARPLRRRRPRDAAPRAGDDVPGDAPPAGLPPGLPRVADPGVERAGARGPARLRRLQLPAVSPGLGPVPHGLRDAAPLRLSAPRDAPPLPAGDELHRLLAPDQHLLERFHGADLLQPGRLPAEAMAAAGGPGGGDGRGLPGDLAAARLPVVLAARRAGASRSPTRCSGASLGGLVAINVQLDARRHPTMRLQAACGRGGSGGSYARDLAVRSLKVAGTFATIALLWSLWSSPSLARGSTCSAGACGDPGASPGSGCWSNCSVGGRMVHDRMTRRHWLATLAILAGGLLPDRLVGAGPARLRQPGQRPVQSGRRRADRARLLRAAPRRRPAVRRPGRPAGPARPPAPRRHLRRPGQLGPAGRPRRRPPRGDAATLRLDRARRHPLEHQRPGHARPRVRRRQARRHIPDRAGGRLDRRGLGRQRRATASSRSWSTPGTIALGTRADPRSRSSTAPCPAMRPASAGTTSSRSAGPCGPTC